jgi:hypothetical protein
VGRNETFFTQCTYSVIGFLNEPEEANMLELLHFASPPPQVWYLMSLSVLGLYSMNGGITNEYGAVGGIRIGKGNRSTRRQPAPVPRCPPQISHDLTRDQTQATKVGT